MSNNGFKIIHAYYRSLFEIVINCRPWNPLLRHEATEWRKNKFPASAVNKKHAVFIFNCKL